MTPAEELTAAADKLDALMVDLTPTPWQVLFDCPEGEHHHDWDEVWIGGPNRETVAGLNERYTSGPRDAAYIAAMNPLIGRALTDWLRSEAQAARGGEGRGFGGADLYRVNPRALALASLIVGGAS